MVAHICNPGTPTVRWQEETADSLKTYELVSVIYALANNKETQSGRWGPKPKFVL